MRIRKRLQLYFGLCKWYGQRKEDKIIAEYFGDFKGTLLSIGENDGMIYSNVLYFLKRGWSGDLIEPSIKAFRRLKARHWLTPGIYCHNIAIMSKSGKIPFYESGSLVNLGDTSLVSSIDPGQSYRWPKVKFEEIYVEARSFKDFLSYRASFRNYDLISIDAEGMDFLILQQMDLKKLGCRCLVVEHGGDIQPFLKLGRLQGFRPLLITQENLIFVKS